MRTGLRVQLLGTLVGAIVVFFIVSALAARNTMSNDLNHLARQEVSNGAMGFSGYWDQKKDQVRLLVSQAAIQESVKRGTTARDRKAMSALLSGIMRQSGLSFLTIVDAKGVVVARGSSGPTGGTIGSPFVDRALTGETVSTAAVLDAKELAAEDLGSQVESVVKNAAGTDTGKIDTGLALVAATPISDSNERTLGAMYGGIVLNHNYDLVDQVTRALGGKAALVLGDTIVSSTVSRGDGTRLVDTTTDDGTKKLDSTTAAAVTGSDTEAGIEYLASIDPIKNDQGKVLGVRWYGVPMDQYVAVQRNTLMSIVLWGLVGMVIALVLAIPVVEAVSRQIIKRSGQIRHSAEELAVIVVGGEVSSDHVEQTKATVEKAGVLITEIGAASVGTETADAAGGNVSTTSTTVAEKALELQGLNGELLGDIIVIETLAHEMNDRMQKASTSVAELKEVAKGLDELVTGRAK